MKNYYSTKKLCFVAVFTALNMIMSSFSIPVPGGHLYLNDVIICLAALVLDPLSAFIVGGVGAFLGDFFFYPPPMFVSLFTHGLQAVFISLIAGKKTAKPKLIRCIAAVFVGAIIMIAGYTFGRAYIYSTLEYAIIKLPFEFLQAGIGAVMGIVLLFCTRLGKFLNSAKSM